MRVRFLWHFPYLESVHGVLDGVPRGPVGAPEALELAALAVDTRCHLLTYLLPRALTRVDMRRAPCWHGRAPLDAQFGACKLAGPQASSLHTLQP